MFNVSEDGNSVELKWHEKTLDVFLGGAVLVDDHIYGANYARNSRSEWISLNWDTGLIAQNVYLFAASQGLAAWFHNCEKENTVKEFKLRPEQRVLFAQSVDYPEKS